MFIDKKGKLFSKISIIDFMIVVVVIGLGVGMAVRARSDETLQILNANQMFYATFVVERVRDFSVEAIHVDDIFYEQFGGLLGKVVDIEVTQAYDALKKDDGTALYAPMEGRHNIYFTLECWGSVNSGGFFVGGNNQLAVGSDVKLKSNKVMTSAKVHRLSEARVEN